MSAIGLRRAPDRQGPTTSTSTTALTYVNTSNGDGGPERADWRNARHCDSGHGLRLGRVRASASADWFRVLRSSSMACRTGTTIGNRPHHRHRPHPAGQQLHPVEWCGRFLFGAHSSALRLGLDQVRHALGNDAIKAGRFKMHLAPGQQAQYEQSGLSLTNFWRNDGKVGSGLRSVDHRRYVRGRQPVHREHPRQHLPRRLPVSRSLGQDPLGRCAVLVQRPGPHDLPAESEPTVRPTAVASSFMIDTVQYFVDNPKAQACITGLGACGLLS
jgi:hypothetical protein